MGIFEEIDQKVREKYGLLEKNSSEPEAQEKKPKDKKVEKPEIVELQEIELEIE